MIQPIVLEMISTFGLLSLLSIGGANATLPEVHRQVVDHLHWMDDATFASLVAIGQTAPGPNVLIVSMIGWHMAGLAGLLAATLAIVLPSSTLALMLGRLMSRYEANRWVGLTRRALAPIAIGFMLASGLVMSKAAYAGVISIAVVLGMGGAILFTRISPLWGIVGGAMVGIIGHRLHVFL